MTPRIRSRVLEGLPVAPGIAIGHAVSIGGQRVEVYRLPVPPERVDDEIERLRQAVRAAAEDLQTTRQKAHQQLGKELASIFEAHLLVLEDSGFLGEIEERIRGQKVNAEWAVHEISEELQRRFERFEVEHLRERSEDVRDVAQHLLSRLAGIQSRDLAEISEGVVIVAEDLVPSEAIRLGRHGVAGFALERGGQTSHTAIIARSLHIPLVGGLAGVTSEITDADLVVVDGNAGRVVLHPTQSALKRYRRIEARELRRETRLRRTRRLVSKTRDGQPVELLANIELPEEAEEARSYGAAGIGLYRSEFLFIEKSPELPSEEEQYETYRRLLKEVAPHPVVVRTFDLGGRKLAREVLDTREENPVMGLRGIRLTLARSEIFHYQLRALCRAAAHGDLRILLPMVSAVEEVRQFREMLDRALRELGRERRRHVKEIPLGVMIEVPSAAMVADSLAREVDFFSIGTNDLIQYAMAVDRGNEHVAYLYRPLHPGILRMIRFTVDGAREAGIGVSLCGEMGAQPRYAPLLVGLGLRSLSVVPRSVPVLKRLLRQIDAPFWERAASECLELHTAEEVESFVEERLTDAGIDTEGAAA
ncbi:MAG: phosphoenolpyruvate--protein phosphotransferase [Thermoanaerobaculia bacterium]|nr:phosphoenolpyruvate--protein phosphotransferase [Thermoanaerobaculia bacterium]